jgi:osmotically-inducible protein OsmY
VEVGPGVSYDGGMRRRTAWPLLALALVSLVAPTLGGCTLAVLGAYDVATDARAFSVQQTDGAIANTIRSELMEAGLRPFLAIDVFCHQGLVVLTGVTAPGTDTAARAVAIARRQEGVRRVETYFFANRPSPLTDVTIGTRFFTRIVFDLGLRQAFVDFAVINGHLVLTGVVRDRAELQAVLEHARSVSGVRVVKSYLQLRSPPATASAS